MSVGPSHSRSRPENLRRTPALRELARETRLHTSDLVLPIFLEPQVKDRQEISSLPGVYQWSLESSLKFVEAQLEAGVRSFILFGVLPPSLKSADGQAAWNDRGPVVQALQKYREKFGDVNLFADACFCEYTDHGHCGPLEKKSQGWERQSEETLKGLGRMAVAYAQAGASIVAPSGMVDGMVGAIRHSLIEANHDRVAICSYAVKYATCFYGPFRDAAGSAPAFGDRKAYQMNVANRREALREIDLDVNEGADMLLVKPGMPCLDIIREAADRTSIPIGAYQVSGEYAMLKAAGAKGWLPEEAAFAESLLALKRAGSNFIITYWAPEAAKLIAAGKI